MVRLRLLSWLWDYLVAVGLLLVVFIFIGVPTLLGWFSLDGIWGSLVLSDIAITLLTVIPFLVYLAATEAGASHATWGKRRTRIGVFNLQEGPPQIVAVWIRNIVKLLPWQFAHMGVEALIRNGHSTAGIVFYVTSLVLLAAVAGPPLFNRRGVHEVIAGTVVQRTDAAT
ncbi:MAG: RDD family protein [Acidimicrobiia bacterium]